MKIDPNPTLIGAFVLGAAVLGSAAVVVFGGRNPFAPAREVVVFFDESVSGLDRGASVEVRGVQSGRVRSIIPTLAPDGRSAVVAVICDMRASRFIGPESRPVDLADRATLEKLVAQGLRARLKPAGLSGEYTVDFDIYDARRYPARGAPAWAAATQPYPEIPAIQSVTGELLEDLQAALREVRSADIEGMARSFKGADLKKTLQQIGEAAVSVKNLADYLERNPNAIISGKKAPAKP